MEYTKNYHLPQWAEEDRILMEDFNAMCGAIESGLTAAKAKADNNGDRADALEEGLADLTEEMGGGGQNCRIVVGNYVGKGESGFETYANKLTFPFQPLLVFINAEEGSFTPSVMVRGCTQANSNTGTIGSIRWEGNSVRWWATSEVNQQNVKGTTYYYIAVGVSV